MRLAEMTNPRKDRMSTPAKRRANAKYQASVKGKAASASSTLRMKYGISGADKQRMIEEQNFKCSNPGCHNPVDMQSDTDHDHVTEQVRGIMCHSCNVALGLLKESLERIQVLALYIQRFL